MKDFHVVYEDNHIIVVNKRAGILVQGDSTGDRTLTDAVKEYIKKNYNKPGDVFLHPVHRLDRPVSGLVIFARTSKGLERMMELFRKRDIQKTYWAVVKRRPKEMKGKLIHWLIKDETKNLVTAYETEVEGSQRAELNYKVLGEVNKHFLLEIELLTGRSHQIRVQLSTIGSPIRGDLKYGFDKPNADGCINLHARRVYFIHPVKKEPIICKAAVPPNAFWEEFLELDPDDFKQKNLDYLHE